MSKKTINRAQILFYVLFAPMCFLVFAYPPNRLVSWYAPDAALGVAVTGLIWIAAAAALWISFASPKMWLRFLMVHWMGAGFILAVLTLGYEIARVFAAGFADDKVAAVWILISGAVLTVGAVFASHFIRVKRLTLKSAKIKRAHRIVQISDIHIGSRRAGFLARVVRRINQLKPDTVVITGDLVDSVSVGQSKLQALGDLRARTFFTLGNHERYAKPERVTEIVRGLGVEVLRGECVRVGEILFTGIDDAERADQVACVMPTIVRDKSAAEDTVYSVLLYHKPLGWEAAIRHGVDLMLSGHTHNGQIFPFNLIVKRQFRRISGLYRNGDAHLYVSPGTGTWGPMMRLGSRNEITCIDLQPLA